VSGPVLRCASLPLRKSRHQPTKIAAGVAASYTPAATREEDAELAAQMKASARLNGDVSGWVGAELWIVLRRGWSVGGVGPRADCWTALRVYAGLDARVGEGLMQLCIYGWCDSDDKFGLTSSRYIIN